MRIQHQLTSLGLLGNQVRHASRLSQSLAPKEGENLNVAMFLRVFGDPPRNEFVRDRFRIATAGRLIPRHLGFCPHLDDPGLQPLPFQGQPPLKVRAASRITTNRE